MSKRFSNALSSDHETNEINETGRANFLKRVWTFRGGEMPMPQKMFGWVERSEPHRMGLFRLFRGCIKIRLESVPFGGVRFARPTLRQLRQPLEVDLPAATLDIEEVGEGGVEIVFRNGE